ncbi:hypothetical protein V6N12_068113 [Hibiscus sabdariffa]|uniref:Photosystem I n=1 Tax=Hibiscus sabdariffa TaxID=183260 RepID=A0ABR2FP16_9ROSI
MGGTTTPRTGSIKSGRLDKLASPLHTSTSVPTFGEIGVMPTKGKGEPSCKSIEGSPTLAGAHSAKVSTKILWLRAELAFEIAICLWLLALNSNKTFFWSSDFVPGLPIPFASPAAASKAQYVESRRDLADPVSKGLGKDLVSRTWRGMGKVHSFHSFGLYIHNDTMSALGRPQDMFSDTAIQLQPVFAQWIQNTHTLAPGATAPGATASTSLTWGGGDLVAVGGKVALLPIPLGTADFLVHHIHAFTIHVTVLILLKGVLFARSSRLIPDKANLGFRFPCDGPGLSPAVCSGFQTQRWQLNTRVALVAGLNPTPYGTS